MNQPPNNLYRHIEFLPRAGRFLVTLKLSNRKTCEDHATLSDAMSARDQIERQLERNKLV